MLKEYRFSGIVLAGIVPANACLVRNKEFPLPWQAEVSGIYFSSGLIEKLFLLSEEVTQYNYCSATASI